VGPTCVCQLSELFNSHHFVFVMAVAVAVDVAVAVAVAIVIARAVAYVVAVLVVVMVQTNGVQDAFFASVLVLLLSKPPLCLPR